MSYWVTRIFQLFHEIPPMETIAQTQLQLLGEQKLMPSLYFTFIFFSCQKIQYLRTWQVQDDGTQVSGEYGEGVEQDMHGYSTKITEGENRGKFQCNLCGNISNDKSWAWMHVEAIHFPGSYEHQCDQCDEKFDTKQKWRNHRSRVHSSKKSK